MEGTPKEAAAKLVQKLRFEARGIKAMILVVIEQLRGTLNGMSREARAAAEAIGKEMNHPVEALVVGAGIAGLAAEIPAAKLHVVDHALLERYTPDGYCSALK